MTLISDLIRSFVLNNTYRRGSRGGAQGARAPPPFGKKWGHTICPKPMSFLEGVGVGEGGCMVSGKGQNKDIKAIYYQNKKIYYINYFS